MFIEETFIVLLLFCVIKKSWCENYSWIQCNRPDFVQFSSGLLFTVGADTNKQFQIWSAVYTTSVYLLIARHPSQRDTQHIDNRISFCLLIPSYDGSRGYGGHGQWNFYFWECTEFGIALFVSAPIVNKNPEPSSTKSGLLHWIQL